MKRSAPRIERTSSIDSEPRTLRFNQIEYAREAALYVMNTNTIEEALKIFTEGLQPVVTARAETAATAVEPGEEQWEYHAGYVKHPLARGLRDECTYSSFSPVGSEMNVLTAPF